MGVRYVIGEYDGTRPAVVMVCSTSGTAFGPLLESVEEAERLQAYALARLARPVRFLQDDDLHTALQEMRTGRSAMQLPSEPWRATIKEALLAIEPKNEGEDE